MMEPTRVHWVAANHVLRYLKGTTDYGLWYRQVDDVRLEGFIDTNWEGSSTDSKSALDGVFNIRLAVVSWYTKNQRSFALSSTKDKYMAASLAIFEAIWMRTLLVELFKQGTEPTVINFNNQSCIKLFENPVLEGQLC